MSKVQIIGAPQSTYVRTVRIAAEEKGIAYDYDPAPPHSPAVKAIHPLGKIPVMRHGDVTLCESRAIVAYLEGAFDGPALTPSDPVEAARTEQWTSMIMTAFAPVLVSDYLFAYVFPGTDDGSPDRARIDAVLPKVESYLSILSEALAETENLGSSAFSLADAYALPVLAYMKDLPESGAMIAARLPLADYLARHESRPSARNTRPPQSAADAVKQAETA